MQQNVAFVFYVVPMLIMAIAHASFSTYNIWKEESRNV